MNRRRSLSVDCVNKNGSVSRPSQPLKRMTSFQDISTTSSCSSIAGPATGGVGIGTGSGDFQLMTGGNRYLVLMLNVLNANLQAIGRASNETLKLKDFDRDVSPELLRNILIYLISTVIDLKGLENPQQPKVVELKRLNDLRVFNTKVCYDATADYLFWNLRRIFDNTEDIFDYQVLFYPQNDPKRVKGVLNFITAFVLFCEQTMEKFYEMKEGLEQELAHKEEFKKLIETLKCRTNARIIQLEEQRNEVPFLQDEIKINNEMIEKEKRDIELLEAEISKHRNRYEDEEKENFEIERELHIVLTQLQQKKKEIVSDGEEILKIYTGEAEMLAAANKEREDLDVQLAKLTTTETVIESLIDDAGHYANELEEFVTFMESILEMVETKNKLSTEHCSSSKSRLESEQDLTKFAHDVEKLAITFSKEVRTKQHELKDLKNEVRELTAKLQVFHRNNKSKEDQCTLLERELYKTQKGIHEINVEIQKHFDFNHCVAPQKIDKLLKEIQECVALLNGAFGPDRVVQLNRRLTKRW